MIQNLIGKYSGNLIVTKLHRHVKGQKPYWECTCLCGKTTIVRADHLKGNKIVSCGCANDMREGVQGYSKLLTEDRRVYDIWSTIKSRCYNINNKSYDRYGGRGIIVWAGWLNDPGAFIEYVRNLSNYGMPGFSLDRFPNNDGNYEPGNLRWATAKEQANNRQNNLTEAQRNGIKDKLKNSCLSAIKIARIFQVDPCTVRAISKEVKA